MSDETLRLVRIERTSLGQYRAVNVRGSTVPVGEGEGAFTAVELLLIAIGACTAADVDYITARRSEPDTFTIEVRGDKVRDESGNRMANLAVTFNITFPDGDAGDAARAMLPRAVARSHDRLCTVSRTVELATPIATRISGAEA